MLVQGGLFLCRVAGYKRLSTSLFRGVLTRQDFAHNAAFLFIEDGSIQVPFLDS